MAGTRVLITGGQGFIGANLARRLSADGHDVHIVSRPNPTRRWNLLDLLDVAARVHPVDLLDRDGLTALVSSVRPSAVFHLAGRVDLDRSPGMARLCITENVTATVNLLDAVAGVPIESFVYASTTEVYGSARPPFREDQLLDPPSPYAASKVAAEAFCRVWARTFDLPVRIVRLASTYGPGQSAERLIPSVILATLRGEPVVLHSPRHKRDFVFVADIVDGIVSAAARPLPAGDVLNLGSTEAVAVEDVAGAVLAEVGLPVALTTVGQGRLNEADCWMTDASRARARLDWTPRVPLREGLSRTIAWYRVLLERGEVTAPERAGR